jgi:hypothetical protein
MKSVGGKSGSHRCCYFRHCCLSTNDIFSCDPQSVTSLNDKCFDDFDIHPISPICVHSIFGAE